jgi:glutathione synthase/RimK-type ligase-like ATP-grasp enzyme
MILILTESFDAHADLVIERLKAKHAEYLRFETADFPEKAGLEISLSEGVEKCSISLNGLKVDLRKIRAIWNRRPRPPKVSTRITPEYRQFALEESTHALQGLWRLSSDRFWVNRYIDNQIAANKPYQLHLANELGFRTPKTLITNEPDLALDFFEVCHGEMIFKCFTNSLSTIYTTRVNKEDLTERAPEIRLSPCLFQEYVPKKVELRVTIIGHKIFTAEIHSQNSDRSKHDWRRYDIDKTPYYPHQLPAMLEDKIRQLMREMGLVFGCVDLVLTPANEYVFLEINPNGQWYWIEDLTGMPLLDNFTEMLIQGTPDYQESPSSSSLSNTDTRPRAAGQL